MFRSNEHEKAYYILKAELEALESTVDLFQTRLSEKFYDRWYEALAGEIYDCFTDEWFSEKEAEFETSEYAGSIDAVFEVAEKYGAKR